MQATDTDLSLGVVMPGVYVQLDLNAPGPSAGDHKALLLGYKTSAGAKPSNTPYLPTGQTDVEAATGPNSMLANGYAHAVAEGGAGAEVWVLPLDAPSAGTASTYNLIFAGTATTPGSIDIWIGSHQLPTLGIQVGDTGTVLSAASKLNFDQMTKLYVTCTDSTGTNTLTVVHKGLAGEDVPIRIVQNGGAGVTVSPGDVVFSGSNSKAEPGGMTLTVGAISITADTTGTDTAAQAGTLLVAAINAGDYPVRAADNTPADGTVHLYFANGHDVRRYAISFTNVTGLSAAVTSQGTVGAGVPSLTAALSTLASSPEFADWALDAVDAATLGAAQTFIETSANGLTMKGQKLHAASGLDLTTVGAIPLATSPTLTSTPRAVLGWSQCLSIRGFELACRMAGARAANSNPAKNWNGYKFSSTDLAPFLLTPLADRATFPQNNMALRTYALCAVMADPASGQMVIVKGRTTSMTDYRPSWSWSCIDQMDYWRIDLVADLKDTFPAVSMLRYSTPKSAGLIDNQSVVDRINYNMRKWESLGLYDGAAKFAPLVAAAINPININRIDGNFPMSPVLDLDQIAVVGQVAG